MPYKTWAVGEEVIAPDFNPIIASQIVAVFASAAARATGWPAPPIGAVTYLTDTPRVLWSWDGTAWLPISSGARGEVGYSEWLANSGALAGAFGLLRTITVAVKSGRRYVMRWHSVVNMPNAGTTDFELRVGGTAVNGGTIGVATASGNNYWPVYLEGRYDATGNVSIAFECYARSSAIATILIGRAGLPWYLRVVDEGPTNAVP